MSNTNANTAINLLNELFDNGEISQSDFEHHIDLISKKDLADKLKIKNVESLLLKNRLKQFKQYGDIQKDDFYIFADNLITFDDRNDEAVIGVKIPSVKHFKKSVITKLKSLVSKDFSQTSNVKLFLKEVEKFLDKFGLTSEVVGDYSF